MNSGNAQGTDFIQKEERTQKIYNMNWYLGLSGEGSGVRGGGVRGTAGLGAIEAAGIKPRDICFYTWQIQGNEGIVTAYSENTKIL